MDPASLRALNLRPSTTYFRPRTPGPTFQRASPSSLRFSSSPAFFRPFSRFHSVDSSEVGDCNSSGRVPDALHQKFLQIVLVSPQIPGNTGTIARTCAASAVGLHLIEPLGYSVDDTKLKRAGLDYWPYVVVKIHGSWAEFMDYFRQQDGEKRLLAFTKRGTQIHSDFSYKQGDWLVFGSETSGLPAEALVDCSNGEFSGGTIRIPMVETYVRCLNLSVSVGIALYEAARQLNYEQMQLHTKISANSGRLFSSEDIFS
ncbi:tRNA (cytidine/uridine-2'-O-)-methyltransferase protein [Dioscorea alata]|uniref:tRNA (Cytidine/uridine-2'-O-)-methyltransferase protein n=4 Tax=Dioscorea alata TaxID=55571 RepID=A0ACB7W9H1_DIOAL|nr:tRNA (cytidine/uridine-2'-O-)-methyltransferase protein [Dioscorea alata]KAH7684313.1 tRNA (cytidine/uridine-2'-O-)-methyltransferase protein [Dioscorea alata]KAH7684316.1 tRNA (cytidine/uridine-2'-O-)-methyltransferase protein [Dioscorea alata]KAH7684319.1 tRNA (cytidine/uridine-2'-O-)-methyltransferase protein [Dioscorea alata]